MRYSTILALATLTSATPLGRCKDERFKPRTLTAAESTVIDIDMEDHEDEIKELTTTKTVICYFSAETFEPWRKDADSFRPEYYGRKMEDWDEWWLDLKNVNVKTIMQARIKRAADAGCHAINPDNIDGYSNDKHSKPHQDGFNYDKEVYIDYVKWLALIANKYNLVTGLKNALEILKEVLDSVEFAVNEQCHKGDGEGDCPKYKLFTQADKAVYNIEYHDDKNNYCKDPVDVNLCTVLKPMTLDTLGGQC